MKRYAVLSASILAVVISACRKNELTDTTPREMSISAEASLPTVKTSIEATGDGKYTPEWNADDSIAVFFNEATVASAILKNTAEAASTAKFEGKVTVAPGEGSFQAFSPACAFTGASSDKSFPVTLGIQHPGRNTFDPAYDFLISEDCGYKAGSEGITTETLSFNRMLSVLRLELDGPVAVGEKVSSFRLDFPGCNMSGEFNLNFNSTRIGSWNKSQEYMMAQYQEGDELVIGDSERKSTFLFVPPCTVPIGTKTVFTTETENYVIRKEFTLTSSMIFSQGALTVLKLNMDNGSCTSKHPAPVESTATLLYSEVKRTSAYGNEFTYTNDAGEWTLCFYSDNNNTTAMQLNKEKVAYIGTPVLDGEISEITIRTTKSFSANFLLCSAKGSKFPSGTLMTEAGQGSVTTIDVSSLGVNQLWIRSTACANINEIDIKYGGSSTPAIEDAFTAISTPGIYNISDINSPSAIMTASEFDQTIMTTAGSSCGYSIFNLIEGKGVSVTVGTARPRNGETVSVGVNPINEVGVRAGSFNVLVAKVSGRTVWLEDKTNGTGYIITKEK